jgi:hypothetical protein
MLTVMLCGAADMRDVSTQFVQVTHEFGGQAWHYLSGEISHLNKATASWEENSRTSVTAADLCVFVIVRRAGALTWTAELSEALRSGTPFIILCLASTYSDYLTLTRSLVDPQAVADEDMRRVLNVLDEMEAQRHLTVVQFEMGSFGDVYRREAAKIFGRGLNSLRERFQRESLAGLLGDPSGLTTADLAAAETLALDEYEEKGLRKRAIHALADHRTAHPDTVLALMSSREQGVQRLAMDRMADLYRQRPPEDGFLAECVALANDTDDVGLARRLVPAIFALDACAAAEAAADLDLTEIGIRRRLATTLESYEGELVDTRIRRLAAALLDRCAKASGDPGWLERCRALRDRLSS